MADVRYHGRPVYDQDDEPMVPAGSSTQSAGWWQARAYELEDALVRIVALNPDATAAGLRAVATDAVQRFERKVAGGENID